MSFEDFCEFKKKLFWCIILTRASLILWRLVDEENLKRSENDNESGGDDDDGDDDDEPENPEERGRWL